MTEHFMAKRDDKISGVLRMAARNIAPAWMKSRAGNISTEHIIKPFASVTVQFLCRIAKIIS